MAHHHEHKAARYFIEQLCTIGVCGALSAVVITMWAIPNGLNFLGPQFQAPFGNPWLSPLLLGGVSVATLALVFALRVWIRLGTPNMASTHIRSHDHPHSHDWGPCRYILAFFPVGLYWLGLIPAAFSSHTEIDINFEDSGPITSVKDGEMIRSPRELALAGRMQQSRDYYEGRTAQLIGQVTNANHRAFGLVRYQISCCAADAVPLNVRVHVTGMTPQGNAFDPQTQLPGKWVEVTGVIHFPTGEAITVLEVRPQDVYVLTKPPANPFVY